MPQSKSRVPWLLALLIAASLWPYHGLLSQSPMTTDAVVWIEAGWPGTPGWLEWVFQTHHFKVGYRPLTALTYSFATAIAGPAPFLHRAVDVAAHVSCAVLVYALGRNLMPTRPRWTALIGVLFFVLHPAVDEVVPYLARRSYSLSTACLLGALVIAVRSLREESRRFAPVQIAVLLVAGFFSHEVAVVGVLLVPLVGFTVGRERRDIVRAVTVHTVLPAVLLATAWGLRSLVVGGMGGYQAGADRALPILGQFWKELLAPGGSPELYALLLVVPYYGWAIYAAARGRERRLVPLFLLLWILGYGVLYASLGVWFPRQVYVATVPLALLFGDVASTALNAKTGVGRALHFFPQLVLLALVAAHSPVVRGQDPARVLNRARWNATFDLAERELESVSEPATVRMVLPYRSPAANAQALDLKRTGRRKSLPRGARQPVHWLACLVHGRDIEIEGFVYFERPRDAASSPTYELVEGRPVVRIPDGLAYFVGEEPRAPESGRLVRADEPRLPPERDGYLFMTSERGSEMIRLPPARGR